MISSFLLMILWRRAENKLRRVAIVSYSLSRDLSIINFIEILRFPDSKRTATLQLNRRSNGIKKKGIGVILSIKLILRG